MARVGAGWFNEAGLQGGAAMAEVCRTKGRAWEVYEAAA